MCKLVCVLYFTHSIGACLPYVKVQNSSKPKCTAARSGTMERCMCLWREKQPGWIPVQSNQYIVIDRNHVKRIIA